MAKKGVALNFCGQIESSKLHQLWRLDSQSYLHLNFDYMYTVLEFKIGLSETGSAYYRPDVDRKMILI